VVGTVIEAQIFLQQSLRRLLNIVPTIDLMLPVHRIVRGVGKAKSVRVRTTPTVYSLYSYLTWYTVTSRRMSGFRIRLVRVHTVSVPGCLEPDILRSVPWPRAEVISVSGIRWYVQYQDIKDVWKMTTRIVPSTSVIWIC
jgi:hypothetical protein